MQTASLITHSRTPLNAEPALDRLRSSYLTEQADFYVRCHGNIPRLNEQTHRLRVGGQVARPLDLSMAELRAALPHRTVKAVMQCAGNRRAGLGKVRPVSGDPWNAGAIGHAEWGGVGLADLLELAGADGAHVAFAGSDDCEADGERFRFGASIPIAKATTPEVLLAFEMNGAKLAAEHGYPLRAVVPGFAGVRSVKWLASITVQDQESDARPQARDYKLFPPGVTKETAQWQAGATINEMPLNSAICDPPGPALLPLGPTTVRGYAVSGGPPVIRVELSLDGGGHWEEAELEEDPEMGWSWTFWRYSADLARGRYELAVRAWDAAGSTQPSSLTDVWNFKGYRNNAWHRVPVSVA